MLEKTTNISKRFYYYISNAFTDMTKIWHHPKINEHISFFIIFLCWVEHVCLFCLCFIPACRVSFVRFYINWPAASSASSSSSSSAGPQLQALDRSVPCQKQQAEDQSVPRQTSTASATSQCSPPETASRGSECSPPDINCKRYIAVFPAGNSKPRIRVFPARHQLQALHRSVPRRKQQAEDQSVPRQTSTASATWQCSPPETASRGSECSPPDINCKRYIAVFRAGNSKPRIRVFPARLQLQALDSSVPRQARTASPGSKRSPPDFNCKR